MGLEDSVDPYSVSNSSKFTDDLALWPADESSHILGVYFITEPGLYTHIQVLAWKQLMLTTISKAVYTYLWLSRVATCICAHGCSPVVHSGCQNYCFRPSGSRENGRISCRHPLQSAWYLRTRRIALASWKTVENSTYPVLRYVRFANHALSHTFNQHLAKRLPRPSAKGL